MMSLLFDGLYMLALLLMCPYWLWKIPQARRYRSGVLQRLGMVPDLPKGHRRIWIHCASVGEASIPLELVRKIRQQYPGWELAFSTFTDTGADRLARLYPDSPVFYWPLDISFCVRSALKRVDPDLVLLVEQELWPNFLCECGRRRIPVAVINGRINAGSVRLLNVLRTWRRDMFNALRVCCVRSAMDGARFARAGVPAERIVNTGSLKYDSLLLEPDREKVEAIRRLFNLRNGELVLVAGSTHPGEDEVICHIWSRLRDEINLRLVLVPRHIERVPWLVKRLSDAGLEPVTKSDLEKKQERADPGDVIVVDTIGDLASCYAICDCAFVGRSLFPPGGGQNMMEPAALGKPTVVGCYTGNFEPEMELLLDEGAVLQVFDESSLYDALKGLFENRQNARAMGDRARRAVLNSRGAADRSLVALEGLLK